MTKENTVWVFGDSYADLWKHRSQRIPIWSEQVATLCNMNLKNSGMGATGVEWVFKHYHEALPNIKKDDIVIFTITKFTRRWILKSQPGLSSHELLERGTWTNRLNSLFINEDENLEYLGVLADPNEELLIAETELFLDAVEAHMKRIGFKVIAFPCFKDCTSVCNIKRDLFIEVNGWLYNITKGESAESEATVIRNFLAKNVDLRFNHMCETNHFILAEKIKKALDENTSIDLLEGFKTDFLTMEMLESGRVL